jgi:5-guanidino-2-oxopentanoate decarboxylase
VVSTVAGKGVLPAGHPLAAGAVLSRTQAQAWLRERDLILAIGTELSETDTDVEHVALGGHLLRVDVDPTRAQDRYRADVFVAADAGVFAAALVDALDATGVPAPLHPGGAATMAELTRRVRAGIAPSERPLLDAVDALRAGLPPEARTFTDMTQIAYAGNWSFPVPAARRWLHPSGYGTLGYAVPAAIGGAIADPRAPTVALVGDGGFLYTAQELVTATELDLPLTVVLWDNDALGQIRDDMVARDIPPTSVLPRNPDFAGLARACGFDVVRPASLAELTAAVQRSVGAGRTIVHIRAEAMS